MEYRAMDAQQTAKYEITAPEYTPKERKAADKQRYGKIAGGGWRYTKGGEGKEVLITCVGDMLCEEKMYKSHQVKGGFDFQDVFQFVRPAFLKSDLVIGNLETTISLRSPYTGEQVRVGGKYHCNAPMEFLDAIKNAGFDFLIMSNNHNCDSGVNGLMETIHHVDEQGFMRTGAFTPEELKRWTMVEVSGIRMAVLAYSTWFNRNEGKLTELGQTQILNKYSRDKVKRDIAAARADGAEYVLVYMHWGIDVEYKTEQSAAMMRMAQDVADCGADYIVGSHTHSLQPKSMVRSADGRDVPVIYSMGNFVTSEWNKISRKTAMLQIRLQKKDGKVVLLGDKVIPCTIPDRAFGAAYPIVPDELLQD